jgi:hypothetical protein
MAIFLANSCQVIIFLIQFVPNRERTPLKQRSRKEKNHHKKAKKRKGVDRDR